MPDDHVVIFHTNDMHGHLDAMARLSTFARGQRSAAAAEGHTVFFWDAGDAADRRVPFACISKGAAFTPILNAMGYSLQTMGNAISLPYGPLAMADIVPRAAFPILAANCCDGDGPPVAGLRAYELISLLHGRTLGVIGLTAPWGTAYEAFGLHFPDFCDLARQLVAELRDRGAVPLVVLSHLGLADDRRLAEAVPGIDLIIGAHSHDRLPHGVEHNGVLIAQAGQFAEALGRVDLLLDPATGRVRERRAQVLDVPGDEASDPAVMSAIAAAEAEAEILRAQPVGNLQAALDLDHFAECAIGNVAADALRERMHADAAMIASGQFHTGLLAGAITLGQLDAACFSSANPCATAVRGAQILSALERGLDPTLYRHLDGGFRGTPVGIPQISGLLVDFDPDAPVGQKVQRVTVQGELLTADRMYRLAHTDAEMMPDYGYLALDEGQASEYDVPTIVREVLADYFAARSPVPLPGHGRWRVLKRPA